jgi:hypothetical protein
MTVQLWIEGAVASGSVERARLLGVFPVDTIAEAVDLWAAEGDRSIYLDADRTAFWGCRFFDNEPDARLAFG